MKEIIMAIIVLFGGLVLSVSTYNDSRSASKLERQGVEVVSEILNEYTEKTKNGLYMLIIFHQALKLRMEWFIPVMARSNKK